MYTYISATKNNSVNIPQVKQTLKYKETLKRLPNYSYHLHPWQEEGSFLNYSREGKLEA